MLGVQPVITLSKVRISGWKTSGLIESRRGVAGIWAAVLGRDSVPVRDAMLENGVIVRPIGEVLAICPPLVITDDEIGRMVDTMADALRTTS